MLLTGAQISLNFKRLCQWIEEKIVNFKFVPPNKRDRVPVSSFYYLNSLFGHTGRRLNA